MRSKIVKAKALDPTIQIELNIKFREAYKYYSLGYYQTAYKICIELKKQHPEVAPIHFALGNILMKQKAFLKAASYYSDAIKLKEDFAAAFLNRANAYINHAYVMKLAEDNMYYFWAFADYRVAIGLKPNYFKAYLNRGACSLRLAEISEHNQAYYQDLAEKDFKKALESAPGDALAHNALGCLYLMKNANEEAVLQFSMAITALIGKLSSLNELENSVYSASIYQDLAMVYTNRAAKGDLEKAEEFRHQYQEKMEIIKNNRKKQSNVNSAMQLVAEEEIEFIERGTVEHKSQDLLYPDTGASISPITSPVKKDEEHQAENLPSKKKLAFSSTLASEVQSSEKARSSSVSSDTNSRSK
jgi:tetratricopeptide (TPR) repeat protein